MEKHAGISRATIPRIERGVRDLLRYVLLLQHFYEKSGIEFVAPSASGAGVSSDNSKHGRSAIAACNLVIDTKLEISPTGRTRL